MTQAESHKWLSTMMENQPVYGRQYYVANKVHEDELHYKRTQILISATEGIPCCVLVGLGHLRE